MSSLSRTRNRPTGTNTARRSPPPNLLKESNRASASKMPSVKQEKRRKLHAQSDSEEEQAAHLSTQNSRGHNSGRIGTLSEDDDDEEEEQEVKPNGRAPTQTLPQSHTNSLSIPLRVRAKDG